MSWTDSHVTLLIGLLSSLLYGSTVNPVFVTASTTAIAPTSSSAAATTTAVDSNTPNNDSEGLNHNPCSADYVSRPISERYCPTFGSTCIYGSCNELSCDCDVGASGFLCDIKCCLDCGLFGSCFNFNGEVFCNCKFGYTGSNCNETVTPAKPTSQAVSSTVSTASVGASTPMTNSSTEAMHSPCSSGFSLRPESERSCGGGFLMCKYGRCKNDAALECVCDEGGSGMFCENTCCLDCGEFGYCLNVNGDEVCNCNQGYTGPSCNQKQETSTISSVTHSPCSVNFTMRPESERSCANGMLICAYGRCGGEASFTCECDEGGSGMLCESMCCLDCGQFGNCFNFNGVEVCNCDQGYTGPSCNQTVDQVTSTVSPLSIIEHSPCSANFSMRPEKERTCAGGMMTCKYGRCKEDNNSLECDCDMGVTGMICAVKCCLDCGEFGSCFLLDNNTEICNCHDNYTGPGCMEVVTKPPKETVEVPIETSPAWYPWVIAVCLLLVLLIILVFLMVWMRRRRVIPVMQIFRYFQANEDDDEREWDAFISYKSVTRDEQFVVYTLLPMLEEMNYSVHLHARDFPPGETIINNILAAIQGSRRTILVITPDFLRSSFTKFEYEQALAEMETRKHRIIPILLDDVKEVKNDMPPALKSILSSVTYIEWPNSGGEKKLQQFWKRIQLSMPKRRNLANSNSTNIAENSPNNPSHPDEEAQYAEIIEMGEEDEGFVDRVDEQHDIDADTLPRNDQQKIEIIQNTRF